MKNYKVTVGDFTADNIEDAASKLAAHFSSLARMAADHQEANHVNNPQHMANITVSEVVN